MNPADFISDERAQYFHERHFNQEAIMLLPGHYIVTKRSLLIVTILGSCISVCLRDEKAGVSGMNHFMLPKGESSPFGAPARYGNLAMELLINQMLKAGAAKQNMTAKVFGGARILSSINTSGVGEQNANFITNYLNNEGIDIVSEDLRGIAARKVFYFSGSGQVLVRRIDPTRENLANEAAYLQSINTSLGPGPVEVFT